MTWLAVEDLALDEQQRSAHAAVEQSLTVDARKSQVGHAKNSVTSPLLK